MIITQYIPDIIGRVVEAADNVLKLRATPIRVYYDFGHYVEIVRNLTDKDKSTTHKNKQYPLVWLVTDFEETMGSNTDLYAKCSLHFVIAVPSDAKWTMQQRRDKTFLPILYPIYAELLKQLDASFELVSDSDLKIEHTKIDRPYWGKQDADGNGTGNLFNNTVDCIEIKNLKIGVRRKVC